MREGQGCVVPVVMSCCRLLEGEQPLIYQWLLMRSEICRTEGVSQQLHNVRSRKRINKKGRRGKARFHPKVLNQEAQISESCDGFLAEYADLLNLDGKLLVIEGLIVNSGNFSIVGNSDYALLLSEQNRPVRNHGSVGILKSGVSVKGSVKIQFDEDQKVNSDGIQSIYEAWKVDSEDIPNVESDDSSHAEEVVDTSYLPGLDDSAALRCLAFLPVSHHWKLALLSKRHRDLVRCQELMELRRQYRIVEQWICIYTSGNNGWTAFDPKQNKWRNLPHANVDPNFDLSDKESLSAGTHLLWLGRETFNFACYKYDLFSNTWDRGPPMITPRCLFGSASCGEYAFVAGGFSMLLSVLNTAERYNSTKGVWESLPPMTTPRHRCSGFFMDGKFYVIGGKTSNFDPLTSGEEYDPEKNSWRTIENMLYSAPPASASFEPSPPLVAVAGNELYAIESSNNLLKSYNKITNSWKDLGTVPVRADFCNGWGLAFKSLGDELFVIGGHRMSSQEPEGVAVFSWRPQPGAETPEWKLVNSRVTGTGNFLFNCAVMAF